MTISITTTGIALTGPLDPVSSIEITDPDDVTQTLDMGLVNSTGMDNITDGTDCTLELSGFFNGFTAFVDPDLSPIASIKNTVHVEASFNVQGAAKITGQLHQHRDGLIKVQLDGGNTNPSDLLAVRFGLFALGNNTPLISYDLDDLVTVDSSAIYIVLPAAQMTMAGRYYIEIAVDNGANNHLTSGYINIIESRLA